MSGHIHTRDTTIPLGGGRRAGETEVEKEERDTMRGLGPMEGFEGEAGKREKLCRAKHGGTAWDN